MPGTFSDFLAETVVSALRDTDVEAKFSFSDYLSQVEIDEGQFSHALRNVVHNAAQAMPVGIPEEHVSKVFDPFFDHQT